MTPPINTLIMEILRVGRQKMSISVLIGNTLSLFLKISKTSTKRNALQRLLRNITTLSNLKKQEIIT